MSYPEDDIPGFWKTPKAGAGSFTYLPAASPSAAPPVTAKEAVKHDDGKADWSLVPWSALEEIIKVLQFGAKKYNEPGQGPDTWNWTKGAGLGKWRTLSAIFRHLTAYAKGQTYDEESGLNHLAHAGCGILFLLHYHKNPEKYGKFD